MLYQLPNGRVIYLSIEQYLNLTEEDIRDLNSMNLGDYPTSPFHGSVIKKPGSNYENPYEKDGIDYTPDSDDVSGSNTIDVNDIPDEDHPSE